MYIKNRRIGNKLRCEAHFNFIIDLMMSSLNFAYFSYTNRSDTLASLSSSSKLASVQLVLNFCLPAASAAPASKRNVPECSAALPASIENDIERESDYEP